MVATGYSTTTEFKAIERVYTAIRYLVGQCDGAAARDDIGFSGSDAAFGHSLANQLILEQKELSGNQLKSAFSMLKKYDRTQLGPAGYGLPLEGELLIEIGQRDRAVEKPKPIVKKRTAIEPSREELDSLFIGCDFDNADDYVNEESFGHADGIEAIDSFGMLGEDVSADPIRDGLNPQQLQALDLALAWWNGARYAEPFVLRGYAGTGKLQPLDEPVLTPSGWTKMGDIKPGDYVVSVDGHRTKVLEIFPHKNADIWRVHFDDGTWTECHEGHLWRVQTKRQCQRGTYQVLPLSAMLPLINEGARRTIGGSSKGYAYVVDCCDPVHFEYKEVPLHPYLLGWLLGDGYLPVNGVITISTWIRDSEEIKNLLDECLPSYATSSLQDPSPSGMTVRRYTVSAKIKPDLEKLGLLGLKSPEKFVPDLYKFNSVEVRKAILSGLLDTDGHVARYPSGKVKVSFSSKSKQLALDVIELCRSLGGKATLSEFHRKRDDRHHAGIEYEVKLRLPFNPFRLSRRAETYGDYKCYQHFKKSIVKAEYVGKKDGQCISVDHPSHLYLTRDYIVTHNSFSVSRIVKAIAAKSGKYNYLRVALCAPTHKAVSVLVNFADNSGLSDAVNLHIATLSSLTHTMPGDFDDNGKRLIKVNSWSKEPHYREFDLVVCDESSMIASELYAYIPQNIPTIFMGDPAQLPPVGEPESLVFSLPTGVELTEVVRYDGAIGQYVTAIREDITRQFPPRPRTDGNLETMQNELWEAHLIESFREADIINNPNSVRALAWDNKRVAAINRKVRAALFPQANAPFIEGDRLMAKEPVMLDKGDYKAIVLQTCQECTVKDVAAGVIKLDGQDINVNFLGVAMDNGKESTLTTVAAESWEQVKQLLADKKKNILASPAASRKPLWAEWYAILEAYNLVFAGNALLHRLQYAYALTVHQSQGSTFDVVYSDHTNILNCKEPKQRNQLLYVASSRAAKKLNILSRF